MKSKYRFMKSQFTTFAYFGSTLVPEDNRKENSEESYRNKYQKHVACSYTYKLMCWWKIY